MSKEKQIEEMALALSEGGCGKVCDCIQGDKFNCHLLYSASVLYTAGYRLASDLAREIFADFRDAMRENIATCEDLLARQNDGDGDFYEGRLEAYRHAINCLEELKKKYTKQE